MPVTRKRRGERGNAIMEFALCAPLLVLCFMGVVGVGLTLGRSIQVTQVTRDTAHMFFDGIDFSQAANQKVVGRLAFGMGLATDTQGDIDTSGSGIVILTQILKIGATECSNGGYSNTNNCPNYNKLVIEKRVVIGNTSLRTSVFGTPATSVLQSDGSILPADYCSNTTVVVSTTSTASSLNLTAGQYTYAVESYFVSPTLSGFLANSAYSYVMM